MKRLRATTKYTLRERVLRPIDQLRPHLALAVSLVEMRDPRFATGSIGIDSFNRGNAIYVAGVFNRIAVAVLMAEFAAPFASRFSIYRFGERSDSLSSAKLFYPGTGFSTCSDAVNFMKAVSPRMSAVHDLIWLG